MADGDLSPLGDPQADEPVTKPRGFMGYLLDEDLGLKQALTGLVVSDVNNRQRTVQTWFHDPQREERRITYPYISIKFLGENIAHEREHRGWVRLGYQYLQNVEWAEGSLPFSEFPIPMDLDYEITTHASSNGHHSQLVALLGMGGVLHPRFGTLQCPGGTVRRVERLSAVNAPGTVASVAGGHLRLFRMIYRIRVPSELEWQIAMRSRVRAVALSLVRI